VELTLTEPAGITLAAALLVHHRSLAALGVQVADLHAGISNTSTRFAAFSLWSMSRVVKGNSNRAATAT
jgi:hypothetical protein